MQTCKGASMYSLMKGARIWNLTGLSLTGINHEWSWTNKAIVNNNKLLDGSYTNDANKSMM